MRRRPAVSYRAKNRSAAGVSFGFEHGYPSPEYQPYSWGLLLWYGASCVRVQVAAVVCGFTRGAPAPSGKGEGTVHHHRFYFAWSSENVTGTWVQTFTGDLFCSAGVKMVSFTASIAACSSALLPPSS